MIALSANSVEAKSNRKRNMSTSSNSVPKSVSNIPTLEEMSIKQDTEVISEQIFKYHSKDVYPGTNVLIEDFIYESAYSNFLDSIICFKRFGNVEIKGGTVINPRPQNVIVNDVCIQAPEEIVIPKDDIYEGSQVQLYTYKFNRIQGNYISTGDYITLNIKPISDLISSDTLTKVKETCDFKSYYSDIKSLLIASTTTAGVATAAGAAGTALNVVETIKERKEATNSEDKTDDKNKKLSNTNIAEIALSGTAAATNMASAITSFISIEKINKLSSQMDKCAEASNKLQNELSYIKEGQSINNNKPFEKYENIVRECSLLSKQDKRIKTIKGLATASGVTGMVGAAASGASIATNVIGNTSDNVDGNKMKLTSTITSGIGTSTGFAGMTLSASNLAEIQDLIGVLENCTDSISELEE